MLERISPGDHRADLVVVETLDISRSGVFADVPEKRSVRPCCPDCVIEAIATRSED